MAAAGVWRAAVRAANMRCAPQPGAPPIMSIRFLYAIALVALTAGAGAAEQRWLTPGDRNLQTTGQVTEHALPHANSGPTTIALAPDGTLWFTESTGNRIGRMNPDGSGLVEYRRADRGQLAAHHRARRRRQHVVLGASRGNRIGAHHAERRDRGVPDSDARQPAACDRARRRRQHLVRHVRGRQDRPHHAGGRHHRVRDPDAVQRSARARGRARRQHLVLGVSTRARSAASRRTGVVTEFPLPRPNSGPGDITAGADGNMWFVELARHDRRPQSSTATASAASRCDGEITEFAIPSADGLADQRRGRPRSQRLVHERRGARPRDARRRDHRVPAAGERARRRPHRRQRSPAARAARESALVRRRQRQQDRLPDFE